MKIILLLSFESFLNKTPSKENIQCSSDCTLFLISRDEYENLYQEVSNWSIFCKKVYMKIIL